jgi:outer membrane immunogenic protein
MTNPLSGAAFLASAVLLCLPAQAADDVAPTETVSVGWSGVYLGGVVGYAWADFDTRMVRNSLDDAVTPGFPYDGDGWTAGAIAGVNWQRGPFVFGVEGDISSGLDGATEFTSIAGVGGGGSFSFTRPTPMDFTTEIDWYGTIRGRLGYAFDTLLLYGTAGVAFAEVESSFFDPTLSPSRSGDSVTQVGYAVGGGVEGAFGDGWSLRLEYLFVDLGDKRHDVTTVFSAGSDFFVETDVQFHTLRTALIYGF